MDSNISYEAWLQEWLRIKRDFVKEATYANYSLAICNHIAPTLGAVPLGEIDEELIQNAVLYWLDCGRIDGQGGLSEKTVKDFLIIITSSIADAYRKMHMPFDPFKVKVPRFQRSKRIQVLSFRDQQALTYCILNDLTARNVGILLALHTGLRIGEICALQWRDIDFDRRVLTVAKTIQRVFIRDLQGGSVTKVVIGTPKTRSSERDIPIPSFMVSILQEFDYERKEAFLLTDGPHYVEPRSYRRYFYRFLKQLGVEPMNFHGLRHTFATRLVEAGADVKTVSLLLGHASATITLDLYVHPQIDQKRRCIELMQLSI